jgi:2-C-methyl-D-erythritol 4-phosphate cytidylyltransferase
MARAADTRGAFVLASADDGGRLPKQYQPLAGVAMVLHTLAAFKGARRLAGIVVAVSPNDRFLEAHQDGTFHRIECGGPTRAATVGNGLRALVALGADRADWVLVHDAARCLVTTAQIDGLINACLGDGVGGLLAQPLADTLKVAMPGPAGLRSNATLERSGKWLAQTPQMFRIGLLAQALEHAGPQVTDEASAIEAMGLHPLLVPGNAHNFKVTYPEDFELAQALLSVRTQSGTLDRFGGGRGEAAQLPGKTIF